MERIEIRIDHPLLPEAQYFFVSRDYRGQYRLFLQEEGFEEHVALISRDPLEDMNGVMALVEQTAYTLYTTNHLQGLAPDEEEALVEWAYQDEQERWRVFSDELRSDVIYRLARKGMVSADGGGFFLTERGLTTLQRHKASQPEPSAF